MSDNAPTRRAVIGGAALTMASASPLAARAVPRVAVETGLETGAIRAIGVETARTDYHGRPPCGPRPWKMSWGLTGR